MNAKVVVHVSREERERGAEARTQYGVRGEHRSCKDCICVDKVVLRRLSELDLLP